MRRPRFVWLLLSLSLLLVSPMVARADEGDQGAALGRLTIGAVDQSAPTQPDAGGPPASASALAAPNGPGQPAGQSILATRRLVTYYGNPASGVLGILGKLS